MTLIETSTTYLFQNSFSWEPESTSPVLLALMDRDLNAFGTLQVPSAGASGRGCRQNITGDQRRALAVLKRSANIIVKPADKGGQTVLQDRADYLFEANRHLDDLNYYKPLQQSMQSETQKIIRTIIQKAV